MIEEDRCFIRLQTSDHEYVCVTTKLTYGELVAKLLVFALSELSPRVYDWRGC
jgi:hypothetical protein